MLFMEVSVNASSNNCSDCSANSTEPRHGYILPSMPALQYFFVVSLVFQSIFGSIGNVLVMGAICIIPALRTTGNYFIVNLAISDLFVTAVAQPSNIIGALFGEVWFLQRPILCSVISTFCTTGCISSTYNICMIAVNRYILICHYEIYDAIYTKGKTMCMCLGVWVIIYVIEMPNHIGWGDTRFSVVFYVCTFANHIHSYAIFYMSVGVVIPVVTSFLAYLGIYLRVKDSNLVRNRIVDAVSSQRGSHEGSRKRMGRRAFQHNVQVARALFRVYVIFFLMWLPVAILILMGKGTTVHPVWYILTVLLAHGNSSINCLVYAASLDHFREGYYRLMGFHRRRSVVVPVRTNGTVELAARRGTLSTTAGQVKIAGTFTKAVKTQPSSQLAESVL